MKDTVLSNPIPNHDFGGFFSTSGLVSFFKSIVKEAIEEVIQNKMYENVVLDQNLTSAQLCERWKISKNTLHAWEDKGIISPIQTGGRKKVYSLKEIKEVETDGYVKCMR